MAWFLVQGYSLSDGGLRPDNSLPGPQPPFPTPPGPVDPGYSPPWAQPRPPHAGWPTVPGWPGGSLPGGGSGFPRPDNTLPGQQPGGIWGGGNVPMPSPPIYIPITPPPDSGLEPTHPIYIPVYPDNTLPGSQPRPDHTLPPYPDNTLPGAGSGGQAALVAKIKKAVEFWTGNLPTDPNAPDKPTPV